MTLYFSIARAKRRASAGSQPGPQSSARPTLSPNTSFIAATQSTIRARLRSVSGPLSLWP